jgi:hypothetical protein
VEATEFTTSARTRERNEDPRPWKQEFTNFVQKHSPERSAP